MSTANDRAVLNHILNPLLPTEVSGDSEVADDEPISHPFLTDSRELEKQGVIEAERGQITLAIEIFDKAIEKCPINPSAYNNRAQALRLSGKPLDALPDLEQAISLSQGRGKSACQAFVQRAMIHRLQGNNTMAKEDFQKAADLGSSFAKMQAVAMNPYAAMCNKMLSEVLGNLKRGKE